MFDALASPGVSVEATVVRRLGGALATVDQPLVLVLDDLHLVDEQACLDAVAVLASHVPDGSQMAVSARGRPVLPVGALRARGLALELGADDLRMNVSEATQLLNAAGVHRREEELARCATASASWKLRSRGSRAAPPARLARRGS